MQIRLLTVRSKSGQQRGGRGTSLESTPSSRLEPRRRREVETAGLAPNTSILLSDTHASCHPYLLALRRSAIVIPQHEGGVLPPVGCSLCLIIGLAMRCIFFFLSSVEGTVFQLDHIPFHSI